MISGLSFSQYISTAIQIDYKALTVKSFNFSRVYNTAETLWAVTDFMIYARNIGSQPNTNDIWHGFLGMFGGSPLTYLEEKII